MGKGILIAVVVLVIVAAVFVFTISPLTGEVINTPTTTFDKDVEASNGYKCHDPDGDLGADAYLVQTTVVRTSPSGIVTEETDYCASASRLEEAFCDNDSAAMKFTTKNGPCVDGALTTLLDNP